MFGKSSFKMFADDPFFEFPKHSDLIGNFPSIEYGTSGNRDVEHQRNVSNRDVARRGFEDDFSIRDLARKGFQDDFGNVNGMFGNMMEDMNKMIRGMHTNMSKMMQMSTENGHPGSNGYSFSSSSFYSYDGRNGSEPKVYQAHHSVRSAPGGVKEERKAMRNSESGEEKMQLGQHIGDRGRVYQKHRNIRTNQYDENRDYIGMAESDEPHFQKEWIDKTQYFGDQYSASPNDHYLDSYPHGHHNSNKNYEHLALKDKSSKKSQKYHTHDADYKEPLAITGSKTVPSKYQSKEKYHSSSSRKNGH